VSHHCPSPSVDHVCGTHTCKMPSGKQGRGVRQRVNVSGGGTGDKVSQTSESPESAGKYDAPVSQSKMQTAGARLRESDWFVRWSALDWPLVPLAVFAIALATRFWRLDHPSGVVFDEFHFGTHFDTVRARRAAPQGLGGESWNVKGLAAMHAYAQERCSERLDGCWVWCGLGVGGGAETVRGEGGEGEGTRLFSECAAQATL
jgi:hypothetical protein